MAGVPAKCTQCGHVFESGVIEIGPGVIGLKLSNNLVSCPQCRGTAKLADGKFNSTASGLELVSGPSRTRELIEQLRKIAQDARAKKLTSEEVLAEVADVNPELAAKLKGIGPWPVYGLILFLFWLVKGVSLDLKIDVNYLIDQAWLIANGERPERYLESAPPEFPHKPAPAPDALNSDPFGVGSNRLARRRAAAQDRKRPRMRRHDTKRAQPRT